MPYPLNTAGAEDSSFITSTGEEFYFFFTLDPSVPAELQIVDGVTGIWYSRKTGGECGEAKRCVLIEEGVSLDGCQWVGNGEIWFCSVRVCNLREIDLWMADIQDGKASNISHGGERLNVDVGIGEFNVTANSREIHFHCARLPSNPTTNLPLMPNDRTSPCGKVWHSEDIIFRLEKRGKGLSEPYESLQVVRGSLACLLCGDAF